MAETLQQALNGLGRDTFAAFDPLKVDGDIGPRTASMFQRINRHAGPDRLTERFADLLGFRKG